MNVKPSFKAETATVDQAAVTPLPKSRKIYVTGSRPDIRVPFREIEQADTPTSFGGERNPPLTVYDTSGPYTDPDATIDMTLRGDGRYERENGWRNAALDGRDALSPAA